MKSFVLIPACLIIIVLVCSSCALQSDVRILEDRIISLEMHNMELQQLNYEAEREKKQIKSQIQNYSETLEQKENALRSQSASLQVLSDRLRNEIQALRGKLEEIDYLLNQKIKNNETLLKVNNRRLEIIERQLNIDQGGVKNNFNTPGAALQPKPAEKNDKLSDNKQNVYSEDELYLIAKRAFDQQKFDLAQEKFQELLRIYPGSKYAGNAQFWIGEIYYRQKSYENAILEYQTVIEKYPKGNKVRASILKQGFSFYNIGDKANAKLILQELIKKFPGSPEADAAKKKLSRF
ncbi:Tol-Pal system, periplasmic component [Desulfonema limicola]|uniref:Tol-Pal system, periplasmic component n=1 Tax=Desulfonema limicola TaxID=45656 RepID=A0A975GGM8_9BACT|nr:tol-pal system protein YbgF [Desulfonema limicola]QTA80505.1 Tol-Pal system, periplasmic component [Desulfonema limicola]